MAQTARIRPAAARPILRIATAPGTAMAALSSWRARRRDRAALSKLDDRLLEDIGLDRAACEAACSVPFWR